MITAEKVALVAVVRETHGLSPALAAVELSQATWYYHQREEVTYPEK